MAHISFHKYNTSMALVYAEPNMAFAFLHKNAFRALVKGNEGVDPDRCYFIQPLHAPMDKAKFDIELRQCELAPALRDGNGEVAWFTAAEVGPALKQMLADHLASLLDSPDPLDAFGPDPLDAFGNF
jgi:hypothetical protein